MGIARVGGEKWRSWWTRHGEVGGDEERVVGDSGKGRVDGEEEESGNVGFSGRDREGRLGNGREKEMGMSETRNGKACVGSGSKEEPEKLLYDGREKKGWSWPLA
jgi:hypothetical protein